MLDEDWVEGERVFIDRDGDLFHHLLAFMRSGKRPSSNVLREKREELITECERDRVLYDSGVRACQAPGFDLSSRGLACLPVF